MLARLWLATTNAGKVREYQALAAAAGLVLDTPPEMARLPTFPEEAPTFAENAAGKALHYSRLLEGPVVAEDSGLVVPALDGAPGPRSARLTGPGGSDADRIQKLLELLKARPHADRCARFVCVLALAQNGRVGAVFSDFVTGRILEAPQGASGFGYDPIFLYEPLGRSFAELTPEEKNAVSHRGRAFRKLAAFLKSPTAVLEF
jgi:XTP/dITP diphosphohydrolase